MALGDYTPTAWVNGTTPAINATNLGKIETKIDELDTLAPKVWFSPSGVGGSDDNAGQQPAPKPALVPVSGANGVGQFSYFSGGPNVACVLPSGGFWQYIGIRNGPTGLITQTSGGISAGGSTILTAAINDYYQAWIWRIA